MFNLHRISARPRVLTVIGLMLCAGAPACRKDAPQQAAAPAPDLGQLATDSEAVSAGRFVQSFYDWYGKQGAGFEKAVRDSGRVILTAPLHDALQADMAAQAADSDEIVGLDWDPFLASQDPCLPYRVGQTYRRGDTLLVTVRDACPATPPRTGPNVVAEVRRQGTRWVFADFRHGTEAGGLLADLAELRRERESARRTQPAR